MKTQIQKSQSTYKVHEWRVHEWQVHEWQVHEWRVHRYLVKAQFYRPTLYEALNTSWVLTLTSQSGVCTSTCIASWNESVQLHLHINMLNKYRKWAMVYLWYIYGVSIYDLLISRYISSPLRVSTGTCNWCAYGHRWLLRRRWLMKSRSHFFQTRTKQRGSLCLLPPHVPNSM